MCEKREELNNMYPLDDKEPVWKEVQYFGGGNKC